MSEIVEQISDDIREKSLQYAVDKLATSKKKSLQIHTTILSKLFPN